MTRLLGAIAPFVLTFFFFQTEMTHASERDEFEKAMHQKVEDLLSRMTVEEKLGQLTLYSAGLSNTGPTLADKKHLEEGVKSGRIGSLFNAFTVEFTTRMQRLAVENSRLGIPLLFGFDVVHGYRTIFPMPLAEAASWDLDAIRHSARIMSTEAAAGGLHWTYAPMVDISRDPRWGRIVEGAGEDTYLGSLIAEARVSGIQRDRRTGSYYGTDEILSSVKHFAAYGAAEGGRDYNTVDISELTMREIYLPPFKAAIDAGAETVMASFNEWNGVPATANRRLLSDILRKEWQFRGFVVSDYTGVTEMIAHGFAASRQDAALKALTAGVDMDMESGSYLELRELLSTPGNKWEETLNTSVRRVLEAKYRLGLFKNPYRYSDAQREKEVVFSESNRNAARDVARKSIVLLKNEAKVLPLSLDVKTVALVGPFAKNKAHLNGSWVGFGKTEESESLIDGLKGALPSAVFNIAAPEFEISDADIQQAVEAAGASEVVIAALGEPWDYTGEAASRADLRLPGRQDELLRALHATGKPVVLVLMNGRPLVLEETEKNADAILEAWYLGTRTGSAVSDVLLGHYNPSGKLPVSFPRRSGVPVYYNHKNTGRPEIVGSNNKYQSKYIDTGKDALYPFGFGLSYTKFHYQDLHLIPHKGPNGFDSIGVLLLVKNTGDRIGRETVQVYLHDPVATITQPVKVLKKFKQLTLAPGSGHVVSFSLSLEDLSYLAPTENGTYAPTYEPGRFVIQVGGDSQSGLTAEVDTSKL